MLQYGMVGILAGVELMVEEAEHERDLHRLDGKWTEIPKFHPRPNPHRRPHYLNRSRLGRSVST